MSIGLGWLWIFLCATARVGGLVLIAPAFSSPMINARVKIGLVLSLALVACSGAGITGEWPANMLLIAQGMGIELITGLLLGAGYRIVFAAAGMAGELAGLQMGVGAASIFDPNSGQSASLTEGFFTLSFTVLFLSIDGHHQLLRVLSESYASVPPGGAWEHMPSLDVLVRGVTDSITFGCRLAAPIVLPLILLTVAIALISRAFPQANVISLNYGLGILLGVVLMAGMAVSLNEPVRHLARNADALAMKLLQSMAG